MEVAEAEQTEEWVLVDSLEAVQAEKAAQAEQKAAQEAEREVLALVSSVIADAMALCEAEEQQARELAVAELALSFTTEILEAAQEQASAEEEATAAAKEQPIAAAAGGWIGGIGSFFAAVFSFRKN